MLAAAKETWFRHLGTPSQDSFEPSLHLVKTYGYPDFDLELYHQANGFDHIQRVMLAIPKQRTGPVPGIVVPFYFPEAMLGFDPENGGILAHYAGIEMLLHLVRRGYAAVSADAFHLTYLPPDRDRQDFSLWKRSAQALLQDHPDWTGMGKLVADTLLLADLLDRDARVDSSRLGIAGHSLGGKMAFYAGCLDERLRVILASDFGIRWEQSNWDDIWYWGKKLEVLRQEGLDHASLLGCGSGKPVCLIAGQFDDASSIEMMRAAPGYAGKENRLKLINHASGHRPPRAALEEGYAFLDLWLK